MNRAQRVYVALIDEGVEVWRPVNATHVQEDAYVLGGRVPDDEAWEFQPGELVRCRERTLSDGATALVAFARVQRDA
jgi:hypothetical protein